MSLFRFVLDEDYNTIANYLHQKPEKIEIVYRISCYNSDRELVLYLLDRGFPMESDYILECFMNKRKAKRSKIRFLMHIADRVPLNKAIIEQLFYYKFFVLFKYFHRMFIYSPVNQIYSENIDKYFSSEFYMYCTRRGLHMIEFLFKNDYPMEQNILPGFLNKLNNTLGYIHIANNNKIKHTRKFLKNINNIDNYQNIKEWLEE